jgi:hypothetical protein
MPGSYPSNPRQKRGRPVRASVMNTAAESAERLARMSLPTDVPQQSVDGTPMLGNIVVDVVWVLTPGGGIPALNTSTHVLGKADCTVYDDDGTTEYTLGTEEVRNKASVAVGASKRCACIRRANGLLYALTEQCT